MGRVSIVLRDDKKRYGALRVEVPHFITYALTLEIFHIRTMYTMSYHTISNRKATIRLRFFVLVLTFISGFFGRLQSLRNKEFAKP